MTPAHRTSSNEILQRLSAEDFALLSAHLVHVDLPLRTVLSHRNARTLSAYFIEAGFASVVANSETQRPIEVGMIGREGVAGVNIVMGNDHSVHEVFMQAPGFASRIEAVHLLRASTISRSLQDRLILYADAFLRQSTQTAVANGRSKIEERLARWLLMAQDRVGGDELSLTHEFLGMMLGTQRPGVTVAIQGLVREGLVDAKRHKIKILDRKALEIFSNGAYVPVGGRKSVFRNGVVDEL